MGALLHNGHGRYGEALADAREACAREEVVAFGRGLVELIEAGVRAGRLDEATVALDRLSVRTQAAGTEWARGTEARCRGLVNDDESAYSARQRSGSNGVDPQWSPNEELETSRTASSSLGRYDRISTPVGSDRRWTGSCRSRRIRKK